MKEAEQIFLAAVELPPSERARFLDRKCTSALLRQEVESLLAYDDGAEDFFEQAVVDAAQSFSAADMGPSRVGVWRLTGIVGHGGMGTVYAGERDDGLFEQKVAVKVISSGARTPATMARFEQERQILAGLSHPNIARLLDGGTLGSGSPYLVMEFVDGQPIDEFIAAQNLSVRQIVELFLPVCAAVEHAHRQFIVHRDVKPGNILVNREGQPKLLDFGIAQIVPPDSSRTQTNTLALTIEYASPEQVQGKRVTAATDVYALGGVLYRLVAGKPPLALEGVPLEVALQSILSRPPVPPESLNPKIGADLAQILLKALHKDPDRRYPSVESFRADLQRYLDGKPVTARGDSWAYRATRYVQRHWLPLAAAAIVFLSIVGALITSRRAQAQAEHEREIAEQARQTAEQERHKAQQSALEAEKQAAEALKQRSEAERQAREASRMRGVAEERTAQMKTQYDRAEQNLAAARASARSVTSIIDQQFLAGGTKQALETVDEWLKVQRTALERQPDNLEAAKIVGTLEGRRCAYIASDNPTLGAVACERAIKVLDGLQGSSVDDEAYRLSYSMALGTLGRIRGLQSNRAEGIALLRRAVEIQEPAHKANPGDPYLLANRASVHSYLADVLLADGKRDQAVEMYREAVATLRRVGGNGRGDSRAYLQMAMLGARFSQILAKSDPERAQALRQDALDHYRLAAEAPRAGAVEWNEYANALNECPYPSLRRPEVALEYARKAVDATKSTDPRALDTLAWAHYRAGDAAKAAEVGKQAIAIAPPNNVLLRRLLEKSLAEFSK
jgi:hypothetical protein